MRIPDNLVEKLLKSSGKFSEEEIKNLRTQEEKTKKPLQDLVLINHLLSEEELTKLYADEIDIPFVNLSPKEIKREYLKLLPERIARQYGAIVFDVDENHNISLALDDPDDVQAINFLRKQLGDKLKIFSTPSSLIQAGIDQYRDNIDSELTKVIDTDQDQDGGSDEEIDEKDIAEDSPVAQSVNIIIDYAVKSGASDIHIEPREDYVLIRYRIDGILKEANKLPRKLLNSLISRIKILSNMKIDEHRAPQDGRFKVEIGGMYYALRVSSLPILDGEKIVMRILNESSRAANFNELGFWGKGLEILENAIIQPHGMILVTGPTGSGKSTTLFSILSKLNTPDVNISTVEDPVEYHIVGANQTQVNPAAGMTFGSGLRALLRQDPNIIMVGEVRDIETADLAIQAALTGHLVFSTLHTNNAATCLPRLLDMGVEPFLIASTIRVVIAQRLVRRLCSNCAQEISVDNDMFQRIKKDFGLSGDDSILEINKLETLAIKDNINPTIKNTTNDLSSSSSNIKRLWKANPDGCEICSQTGYKGRIGIYEVLPNTEELQHMIINNTTSEDIENYAISTDKMVTMKIDGLIKSLRGQTTIEEVFRVTSAD
jgi:type IV pilus assembly protein PilB